MQQNDNNTTAGDINPTATPATGAGAQAQAQAQPFAALEASLPASRRLDALELNEIRFSGRHTVITPSRLRKARR